MKYESEQGLHGLGYHVGCHRSTFHPVTSLSCGIIKVVSNGRGLGLLAEVVLAAINLLGWCTVEVSFSSLLHCLLPSACALVVAPPNHGL